jgi:GTPase SAR1 family protein
MTRVYYKEAVGAFIVFDVTRVSTFEAVQKWKHDIDSKVRLSSLLRAKEFPSRVFFCSASYLSRQPILGVAAVA